MELLASTFFAEARHGGTSSPIDTTGATLLVVGLSRYLADPYPLVDSYGNTWVELTAQTNVVSTKLFYVINPVVGPGHTVTYDGNGSFPVFAFMAFTGAEIEGAVAESGSTVTGTSIRAGALSPTTGAVFVSLSGTDASSPGEAVDSNFVPVMISDLQTGNTMGGACAYKINTQGASEDPQWSGSSVERTANLATFPFRAFDWTPIGGEVGAWIPTISGDNDAGDLV